MDIEFQDSEFERLAFDGTYIGSWSSTIIRQYRRRLNVIMQAPSRQTLYAFRGLKLKKLGGKYKGYHSVRINKQYRIRLKFVNANGYEKVRIIKIEDPH
ncbi:MAG: type II toxin-antitoxin system RelE/ParE family toxin [candidate division Zixibacteria bacterium]|nr:type II toxin-antitoxin system RelE/ParE family toxin [candidate division Zixibacteria bacterium]